MEILIKQRWIDLARAAGACNVPGIGTPVSDLTQSQLVWCEGHQIVTSDELLEMSIEIPLWCLSGYGDGCGYGCGYGSCYGDGYGYGHGDDYGDGYGDGYGDDYGSGYGDGYGSGKDTI